MVHGRGNPWEEEEDDRCPACLVSLSCGCGCAEAASAERLRIAATWTDGPDSESARAARGEGTNTPMLRATVLRWMADRFEFEANLPEVSGQTFAFGHLRTASMQGANLWAARKLRELADSDLLKRWPEKANPRPDPAHVPAVRRVVAWVPASESDSDILDDPFDAYSIEASNRIEAMLNHGRGTDYWTWRSEVGEAYAVRVQDRYAAWLRHRDEKAGCL